MRNDLFDRRKDVGYSREADHASRKIYVEGIVAYAVVIGCFGFVFWQIGSLILNHYVTALNFLNAVLAQ